MSIIPRSELIINSDGSIYHLNLRPGDLSSIIMTVGDPDRVKMVSSKFDSVDIIREHREFLTHTGTLKGKRLSVMSTGIGPDNIDIAMNEADAVFNLDFNLRQANHKTQKLHFIRIGTSGTFRDNIPVDSFLVSEAAIGLDNLMHYYQYQLDDNWRDFFNAFIERWKSTGVNILPYMSHCNSKLLEASGGYDMIRGITLTAPGFYAPQGRKLRAESHGAFLNDVVIPFSHDGKVLTNFEMETAAMYGLANSLGHEAISFNAILANRITGKFSQQSSATVDRLIDIVLDLILKTL